MSPHVDSLSRRGFLTAAAASAVAVPLALAADRAGAVTARPAMSPAGVPAMTTIWSTDFSHGFDTGGGNSYSWESTDYNDEPQGAVKRPTIVTSPADSSKQAARFHLDGGQKRNESQPNALQDIGPGEVYLVRFTDYLADGFPTGTDDFQVILQFKNDGTGSPPCEIKVGHGQYFIDGNNGAWSYDIGAADTGTPVQIAVQVTFSESADGSSISAWYNGQQTLSGVKPKGAGTLYSGLHSYLKTGIYRDTAISEAGTRYLLDLALGTPA